MQTISNSHSRGHAPTTPAQEYVLTPRQDTTHCIGAECWHRDGGHGSHPHGGTAAWPAGRDRDRGEKVSPSRVWTLYCDVRLEVGWVSWPLLRVHQRMCVKRKDPQRMCVKRKDATTTNKILKHHVASHTPTSAAVACRWTS